MANVNFFSPDGGTTRYPIEDTEARSRIETAKEQVYADNGVLGAKNFLNNIRGTATINGITYIENDDGSVTINGTATGQSGYFFTGQNNANEDLLPRNKKYILSTGAPIPTGMYVSVTIGNSSSKDITNNNTSIAFTTTSNANRPRIIVNNGQTINNLTIYPMLRLASDPDDTYQPYVMTNRELTEAVFKKRTLTSADDLNNITETGIYGIASAPTNSPENTDYASLIVQKTSSTDIRQIIFKQRSAGGNIYVRASYTQGSSIAWTAWNKFTGTVVS